MQTAIAKFENNYIRLRCDYRYKDLAKNMVGRAWNPTLKCWDIPVSLEVYEQLKLFPNIQIDKRIEKAVKELTNNLKHVEEMKEETNAKPIVPMPIKTKPYNHQILGFNIGMKLKNTGLFMEQGCGKTLTAIAIIGAKFLNGEMERALIVAPCSVLPVWKAQIEEHADFSYEIKIIEGDTRKRIKIFKEWERNPEKLQIAIINYEAVWLLIPHIKEGKRCKWDINTSVYYATWRPDIIVCDESQRIKNARSYQARGLHRLADICKYRMILTGTPVTQNILDLFSQYRFLNSTIFGKSFVQFRNKYAIMGGYGGYELKGINKEMLQELILKAHSIAYRITKKEALDLPETIDQVLYCYLEKDATIKYKELKEQSFTELNDIKITATNVLTKLLRLSQFTGGFMKNKEDKTICVSNSKMKLLEETLEDLLGAGKKVVIFARFIPEIKTIKNMLEKKGIEYSWIAGEVKNRGEQVDKFMEEENCKVFIAQIQTAGLGITLTAADTAIFYSVSYSYGDYDQAKARIHRIGQTKKCTYIHLVARATNDKKIINVLQAKKDVADMVVDNWRDYFS